MKRNLVILLFTLNFITVFSQLKDENGFNIELHKGTAILVPTWDNIFNTISMPNDIFKELMNVYGYEFISEKNYWWKMSEIEDSDFFIEKTKFHISFIWKNTSINTQELENKFKDYFVEIMANGAKKYLIKLEQNPPSELVIFKTKNMGFVTFEIKL